MKYKIGDKVKVRNDLESNKEYGVDQVIPEMLGYVGKYVTIDKYIDDEKYLIQEDNHLYYWTNEMFEDEVTMDTAHVIQWLGEHYLDGTYTEVFGYETSIDVLIKLLPVDEIVKRICDYEKGKS